MKSSMNKWVDDALLYDEIIRIVGEDAEKFWQLYTLWEKSLPTTIPLDNIHEVVQKVRIQKVNTQRRYRVLAGIGLLAASIVIALFVYLLQDKKDTYLPQCTTVIGEVRIQRKGILVDCNVGTFLTAHDTLITSKKSMVYVKYNGFIIKVDENSRLSIESILRGNDEFLINLHHGKVYATIMHTLRKGGSFRIATPTAVAGIRGTSFIVIANENMTNVVVLEGSVLLFPRIDESQKYAFTDEHLESLPAVVVPPGMEAVVDRKVIETIRNAIDNKSQTGVKVLKSIIPIVPANTRVLRSIDEFVNTIDHGQNIPITAHKHCGEISDVTAIIAYGNDRVLATDYAIVYCSGDRINWKKNIKKSKQLIKWNERVVVVSENIIYALHNKTGSIVWYVPIEGEVLLNAVSIVGQQLIIPIVDGIVYFINENGKILHVVNCYARITSSLALCGQMLCMATSNGFLYGIDINLGAIVYRKNIGNANVKGIVAHYPYLYVATDTSIYKFNILSDEIELIYTYPEDPIVFVRAHPDGVIITTSQGQLCKFTIQGSCEWKLNIGELVRSCSISHRDIVCITSKLLYHISDKGEILWAYSFAEPDAEIVSVSEKKVYVRYKDSIIDFKL